MKTTTITDIRELCSLGLDWQRSVPTLLHMLHALIPSRFNMFFWINKQFEISNAYAEAGPLWEAMRIYLHKYYNQLEAVIRPRFSDAARTETGVTDWEQYYQADNFVKSKFYHEVFQPAGIRYTLRGYIPVGERNAGLVILNRSISDPPFSQADKTLLGEIIPYISNGMAQNYSIYPRTLSAGSSQGMLARGEVGLLLLDQQGKVLLGSPRGYYLLFLATHPIINPATVTSEHEAALPPEFRNLFDQVSNAYEQQFFEPYTFCLHNGWGMFSFCTHLLNYGEGLPFRFGISIQHHELMQTKLLRSMSGMPLSPGQKRVCLLLLEGFRYSEMAEILNISQTTVRDYVRMIYGKLNAHSHSELLAKLLSNPDLLYQHRANWNGNTG